MAIHDRAWQRAKDFTKSVRKRNISRHVYGFDWYTKGLHEYSDNKIHCSCPLCRGKAWSYGNNSLQQNTIADQRKIAPMEQVIRGLRSNNSSIIEDDLNFEDFKNFIDDVPIMKNVVDAYANIPLISITSSDEIAKILARENLTD